MARHSDLTQTRALPRAQPRRLPVVLLQRCGTYVLLLVGTAFFFGPIVIAFSTIVDPGIWTAKTG